MMKNEIRKKMIKIKQPETMKVMKTLKIQDTLLEVLKNYQSIALYNSIRNEVEMQQILEALYQVKEIYLPAIEEGIVFRRLMDFSKLKTSKFGIDEPYDGEVRDVNDFEVIVVPCVAINQEGYRIGYGKGYYDRALQNYKGIKIATVFNYQIVDYAFQEPHDIRVDYVITEDGLRKLGDEHV